MKVIDWYHWLVSPGSLVGVNCLPIVLFTLCEFARFVRFVAGRTNLTDFVFWVLGFSESSGSGVAGPVRRLKVVCNALGVLSGSVTKFVACSLEDLERLL